jgi:TRAP-type uncharacterized transport system substrate-binding protein
MTAETRVEDQGWRSGMRWQDRAVLYSVAIGGLLMAAGLIAYFWQPTPPRTVVMSTGPVDGAYHAVALQYRSILARSDVKLVLKPSTGAVENLERLRTGEDGVSLALVQGGLHQPGDEDRLVSLGAMFYEPLWLFYRQGLKLEQLNQLQGLRVAAGIEGSGTQVVVRTVLDRHGLTAMSPPLVPLGGLAAAQALESGEVDAVFYIAAAKAPAVQRLLRAPGVGLWSVRRAQAFTRQLPVLTALTLPEGAVDIGRSIPPQDVQLVALKAELVARSDIHPVLAGLLLDAAREVHAGGAVVNRPGEFPSADTSEYPLSDEAERYYKSGPSGLRRYLPYGAAVWLQRLIFLGLPILAVGIPLLRTLPGLYRWSIRRRIYRWYGELAFIERAARRGEAQGEREAQRRRLAEIEERIEAMRLPSAYASEAYALRAHLVMVRELLAQPADLAPGATRAAGASPTLVSAATAAAASGKPVGS